LCLMQQEKYKELARKIEEVLRGDGGDGIWGGDGDGGDGGDGDGGDGGDGDGGDGDGGDGGNGGGEDSIAEKIRRSYYEAMIEGRPSLEQEALDKAETAVRRGLVEAPKIRSWLTTVAAGWDYSDFNERLRTFIGKLPELQVGGTVLNTGIAEVHEGEWVGKPGSLAPSGKIIIDNTLQLDGKDVYKNQKEYEQRETYQKTGVSTSGGHAR